MSELKPCPFCGRVYENPPIRKTFSLVTEDNHDLDYLLRHYCDGTLPENPTGVAIWGSSFEVVVERWNRRFGEL